MSNITSIREWPCRSCGEHWKVYYSNRALKCNDCMVKFKDTETGIYGIVCDKFIKIGITSDLHTRFQSLGAALPHPIEKLFFVRTPDKKTAREKERILHDALKPHSIKREWFIDCDDVRDALNYAGINVPAKGMAAIAKRLEGMA